MTRRPVIKRLRKVAGAAFVVEVREGLYAAGVLHNSGCTSFLNHFLSDPDEEIPDAAFTRPLFTVDVQQSFFSKNKFVKLEPPAGFDHRDIPVSDRVIRLRSRPYDPENPFGHDGPFPYCGGDLFQLRDRYEPSTSSTGTPLISDLQCKRHRAEIEGSELSVLYIDKTLLERLAVCYLSGGNFDPYKARVFEDCAYLRNEHVLNTSWFIPQRMPLLGLRLIDGEWRPDPEAQNG